MDQYIAEYIKDLTINLPIDGTRFSEIISSINCNFPQEYLEFLRETGGGEGKILDGKHVHFLRAEELVKYNDHFEEFIPNFFIIATDGGGTGFAIRRKEGTFVALPLIGADDDIIENVGEVFREFLAYLSLPYEMPDGYDYSDDNSPKWH